MTTLFSRPHHPYTKALLAAVPVPDPKARRDKKLPRGEIPSAINPPGGCHFHPRCPYAVARCREARPPLREVAPGQLFRLHPGLKGESTMKKRRLGRTDIEITPDRAGVLAVRAGRRTSPGRFWDTLRAARPSEDVVAAALKGGINWFDTAEAYGNGHVGAEAVRGPGIAGREARERSSWPRNGMPFFRTARSIAATIDTRHRVPGPVSHRPVPDPQAHELLPRSPRR